MLEPNIVDQAGQIQATSQAECSSAWRQILGQFKDPLHKAYMLASMLGLDVEKEQQLLEAGTRLAALRLMHEFLAHELQVLELRRKIASQAQTEMSREQRDYFLRQQMRAIQEELGEKTPEAAEIDELRAQAGRDDRRRRKEAERELKRLERLPPRLPTTS